jgi:hypothetical protein
MAIKQKPKAKKQKCRLYLFSFYLSAGHNVFFAATAGTTAVSLLMIIFLFPLI